MKPLSTQHTTIPEQYILDSFERFLIEDQANYDLSTQYSIDKKHTACAHIIAEEPLIFSGSIIFKTILKEYDVKLFIQDGESCNAGDLIAKITAPAQLLLSYERILLNLIQRLSGISFLTAQYVQTLNSSSIKILDTRKTTPGIRLFEKYAVCMGGGYNHRLDLYHGVMLKDNHLTLINDLEQVLNKLKQQHPTKKIQIEIDYFDQLQESLKPHFQIDAILLDNMNRTQTIQCVNYIAEHWPQCFIESSGGIHLDNLHNYVDTGIHAISIGALTHQAVSKNIKLEFK